MTAAVSIWMDDQQQMGKLSCFAARQPSGPTQFGHLPLSTSESWGGGLKGHIGDTLALFPWSCSISWCRVWLRAEEMEIIIAMWLFCQPKC